MAKAKLLDIDAVFDGFEIDEKKVKQSTAAKLRYEDPLERTKASNIAKGKVVSCDSRQNMSAAAKSRLDAWWTNGTDTIRASESPGKDWVKGRVFTAEHKAKMSEIKMGKSLGSWWNNGVSSTRSSKCPGKGWIKGRLPISDETRVKISMSMKKFRSGI